MTENSGADKNMKRIGNLWDRITNLENLERAHKKAREDKTYYREVKMVDSNPEFYLKEIQRLLREKAYKVSDYIIQEINDKGKHRILMKLQYFPDRIIQWAIMLQIESTFVNTFCHHTCASIPGRGIKKVYNLMNEYLEDEPGTKYCLQIDVRKFYDSINHAILKKLLRRKIKDKDLLWLLDTIIDSYPGDAGVPIGSYLSQYLANFYLCYFDHYLKEKLHIKYTIRYMDDIVIFAKGKAILHLILVKIKEYLKENLALDVKPNWQIYPVNVRGVAFIGYRYFRRFILLSSKTLKRFKNLCHRIAEKKAHKQRISYKEWCGVGSYIGWLKWCNGYNLCKKYVYPIQDMLVRYYKDNIAPKKKDGKTIKALKKYRNKLYNNSKTNIIEMDFNFVGRKAAA